MASIVELIPRWSREAWLRNAMPKTWELKCENCGIVFGLQTATSIEQDVCWCSDCASAIKEKLECT